MDLAESFTQTGPLNIFNSVPLFSLCNSFLSLISGTDLNTSLSLFVVTTLTRSLIAIRVRGTPGHVVDTDIVVGVGSVTSVFVNGIVVRVGRIGVREADAAFLVEVGACVDV